MAGCPLSSPRALVAYLSERYSIDEPKIETHSHVASTPTVCPGNLFPTESLLITPKTNTVKTDRRQPTPTSWKAVRRNKSTY